MKLLLALFALALIASCRAQDDEPTISCVYAISIINNVQHYTCHVMVNNPKGFDDFESISGDHHDDMTNDDVTVIQGYGGSSTIVPRVICSQFPNMQVFTLYNVGLQTITDDSFGGCSEATTIGLYSNQIGEVSPNAFANNPKVTLINLANNRLRSLPETVFANQVEMTSLDIRSNPFEEQLPGAIFSSLPNLFNLLMNDCRITEINAEWFANLSGLYNLNIYDNQISELPEDIFVGLEGLVMLNLNNNRIRRVDRNAFRTLEHVQYIYIENNEIEELPAAVFVPFASIQQVGLRGNRLKTVGRCAFGSLSGLTYIDLDSNVINAVEESLFDEAVNLWSFYFGNNVCANAFIYNFMANRAENLERLARCFRNFRFTVGELSVGGWA
jgi:hypothetical protein